MTHFKTLITTASAAALLVGTTAMADVTALQVWEDWKKNLSIYGDDAVTIGSETTLGGTVTIADVGIDFSDSTNTITADLGTMIFTEQGDGTVRVTMTTDMPMSVTRKNGRGGAQMNITNSGLLIIASGVPGAMNYDVKADQYGLRMGELIDEDGTVVDGDIYVAVNNLSGQYNTSGDAMREIDYNVQAGSVDLLIDIAEDKSGNAIVMSGKMNDIAGSASVIMPEGMNMSTPETMFVEGVGFTGDYVIGSANYIFDFEADGSKAAGSASMGTGRVDMALDDAGVSYDTLARDVAINVQSDDLPFPINIGLSEYGVGLTMPLTKSEDLSNFGFSLNMTDLSVNDEIWMLGDPSGQLSHDPATIKLDLSGKAKVFVNFMDPVAVEEMAMDGAPGELHALNLNDLQLKIAGALLTGTGGFTFDNAVQSMIPGLPQPEGEITLNLTGANKLIDSLVAMGLLPEDQAMMGRMMMGMFARTVGDDQLSSTIEINAQGHILANGQRIQ